jgi:hypothetical protein
VDGFVGGTFVSAFPPSAPVFTHFPWLSPYFTHREY